VMTISAYIEKQKLLDWLGELYKYEVADAGYSHDHSHVVRSIIKSVESGHFDWTGEGD